MGCIVRPQVGYKLTSKYNCPLLHRTSCYAEHTAPITLTCVRSGRPPVSRNFEMHARVQACRVFRMCMRACKRVQHTVDRDQPVFNACDRLCTGRLCTPLRKDSYKQKATSTSIRFLILKGSIITHLSGAESAVGKLSQRSNNYPCRIWTGSGTGAPTAKAMAPAGKSSSSYTKHAPRMPLST